MSDWAHDLVNSAAKSERGQASEVSLVSSSIQPKRNGGADPSKYITRPPRAKFGEMPCPNEHARF
jgi:hypothetical protein